MKTIDGLEIDVTSQVDIIMPSFHSEDLTSLAIRSFIQHSSGFNFNFYVVENSTDTSYRDEILSLSDQITWIQNPTKHRNSEANAAAIAVALERATMIG